MSAGFPFNYRRLTPYLVSRPPGEMSGGFINEYEHLQTNCVSRRRFVESAKRIASAALITLLFFANQPPPQPVLTVVIRIPPPPGLASQAMPLPLTIRIAAHLLATTHSAARPEPSPAHLARSLLLHPFV
jgi:hypothetical protein